ncbi:MAG: tetratricopeptide repeat protein [Phycisphaerales bacterium]|nr:tetratricopeptide repeat protein [Phycisphaerales bacterium]
MSMIPVSPAVQKAYALFQSGDLDACEKALTRHLQASSKDLNALLLLGRTQVRLFKDEQAEFVYKRALAIKPDWIDALGYLADLYMCVPKYPEAEKAFRRITELAPNFGGAHAGLAQALRPQGKIEEAVKSARRAFELEPENPNVCNGLADVLQLSGRLDECVAVLKRNLELHPKSDGARHSLMANLNYLWPHDPEEIFRLQSAYAAGFPPTVLHQMVREPVRSVGPIGSRPLRVGFLSYDLRAHSVAFFLLPIIEHAEKSRVEYHLLHTGPKDSFSAELARWAKMHDLHRIDPVQVAQRIRALDLDVLIELGGHTAMTAIRLTNPRLAPVQGTYLGFPGSTCMPEIDVRIVDSVSDPAEARYDALATEKLLRLERCFLCYEPLVGSAVEVEARPSDAPVVFGGFNAVFKMNDHTLELWAKVLHAVEGSRLVIKNAASGAPATRERLGNVLKRAGIDESRVEFPAYIPGLREHMMSYSQVDIALDCFPYNGTTTTCDAMWMGVPTLTIEGNSHVSRVGASINTAAGLSEFIARDEADFVQRAATLSRDRAALARVRMGLRERMNASPLRDGVGMARAFERALIEEWNLRCAVSKP